MNRSECYEKIKKYNLGDLIKAKYGLYYTNLKTITLVHEINTYEESQKKATTAVGNFVSREAYEELLEVLYAKHLICASEYERLMSN